MLVFLAMMAHVFNYICVICWGCNASVIISLCSIRQVDDTGLTFGFNTYSVNDISVRFSLQLSLLCVIFITILTFIIITNLMSCKLIFVSKNKTLDYCYQ